MAVNDANQTTSLAEPASPEEQVTMVFGKIDKGFKPAAK